LTTKTAFKKYLDSYLQICPILESEELEFIHSNLSLSTLSKKEYFLKSGAIQKEMGFLYSGLL
jgi:hypothetical protein